MNLLRFGPNGIEYPQTGVHIDPWGKVESALLTHAHADHARFGHRHYIAHSQNHERTRLLPIALVYSGLTDTEIREVDIWIKAHTIEKFGSVLIVSPELLFEIDFEAIQRSNRHKSGLATAFSQDFAMETR